MFVQMPRVVQVVRRLRAGWPVQMLTAWPPGRTQKALLFAQKQREPMSAQRQMLVGLEHQKLEHL